MRREGVGVCVVDYRGRGGWEAGVGSRVVNVVWRRHDSDGAVIWINKGGRDAGERALSAEIVEIWIIMCRCLSWAEETLLPDRGGERLALFAGSL